VRAERKQCDGSVRVERAQSEDSGGEGMARAERG
jgi:hypothetical protein